MKTPLNTCVLTLAFAWSVGAGFAGAQSRPPVSEPDTSGALPDPRLIHRWAGLMATVLADFQKDGRSAVAEVEADFGGRIIRIHVKNADDKTWVSRTLTAAELETADLGKVAHQLYEKSVPGRLPQRPR